MSIFGGHSQTSLGAAWLPQPQLPHLVLSGGGDACLRLWDVHGHKAEHYEGTALVADIWNALMEMLIKSPGVGSLV